MPTILITGGTGKIGRQFVAHFAGKDWRVLFTSTSDVRAESLENEFSDLGDCKGIVCNFMEDGGLNTLYRRLDEFGWAVNHIVNNARSLSSLNVDEQGFSHSTDIQREYHLGVIVPYEITKHFWQEQPEALESVTNIGSMYGMVAVNPFVHGSRKQSTPIHYGVTKAALHHLTRELAVRMAPIGVRVNAIAYGGVEGRTDEAFVTRYSELVPSGRMLSEEEVVGPLDFLTSPASSSVTGHILAAEGGWTVW